MLAGEFPRSHHASITAGIIVAAAHLPGALADDGAASSLSLVIGSVASLVLVTAILAMCFSKKKGSTTQELHRTDAAQAHDSQSHSQYSASGSQMHMSYNRTADSYSHSSAGTHPNAVNLFNARTGQQIGSNGRFVTGPAFQPPPANGYAVSNNTGGYTNSHAASGAAPPSNTPPHPDYGNVSTGSVSGSHAPQPTSQGSLPGYTYGSQEYLPPKQRSGAVQTPALTSNGSVGYSPAPPPVHAPLARGSSTSVPPAAAAYGGLAPTSSGGGGPSGSVFNNYTPAYGQQNAASPQPVPALATPNSLPPLHTPVQTSGASEGGELLTRPSSGMRMSSSNRQEWPTLPPGPSSSGNGRRVIRPTDRSLDAVVAFVQSIITHCGGRFGNMPYQISPNEPIKKGKHCVYFQVSRQFSRRTWDILIFPYMTHFERQTKVSGKVWFKQFMPEVQEQESTPRWRDRESGYDVESPPYIVTLHSEPLENVLANSRAQATRQDTLEQVAKQLLEPIKHLHQRRTCHLSIFRGNVVRLAGVNSPWAFRECSSWISSPENTWRPIDQVFDPHEYYYMDPEAVPHARAPSNPAMDIWQLGILLFDLFSEQPYWPAGTTPEQARLALLTPGQLPHERDRYKFEALALRDANSGRPPRLARLSELLRNMITRSPAARRTYAQVESALKDAFPDNQGTIVGNTMVAAAVTGTINLSTTDLEKPAFGIKARSTMESTPEAAGLPRVPDPPEWNGPNRGQSVLNGAGPSRPPYGNPPH